MNIEDQVVNLELSKLLKEFGVEQISAFHWVDQSSENIKSYSLAYFALIGMYVDNADTNTISAYTVAELMQLLPAYVDIKTKEPFNIFYFKLQKRSALNIQYIVNYECDSTTVDFEGRFGAFSRLIEKNIYDYKLPDCLAKILIYLLENNLIEMEKKQ